jgi:hypothetical protein
MANFFAQLAGVFFPASTGSGVGGVSTTAVGAALWSGLAAKCLAAFEAAGMVPAGTTASLSTLLPALGQFLTVVGARNALVNTVNASAAAAPPAPAAK